MNTSSVSVVQHTTWPAAAPDPKHHPYRLWTADTSETTAVTRFKDRYGHPPDWIIEHLGWLWLGPIPKRQRSRATRGRSTHP